MHGQPLLLRGSLLTVAAQERLLWLVPPCLPVQQPCVAMPPPLAGVSWRWRAGCSTETGCYYLPQFSGIM